MLTFGQLQHRTCCSTVHLCLHLKVDVCMELVHTCTKYGYMQPHTRDMHEKKQLFYNDMIFGSQVSGLAKLRLGNLCHETNIHHHNFLIFTQQITFTHSTYHIAYNRFFMQHITSLISFIHSYAMRPRNRGINIKTSQT